MTLERRLAAIAARIKTRETTEKELRKEWLRFGRELRSRRRASGLGLEEFAMRLQRSETMVAFMESGRRQWPMKLAEKAVGIVG